MTVDQNTGDISIDDTKGYSIFHRLISLFTGTQTTQIRSDLNAASRDMDDLSATGQNIANWSSNVSNCITEIPQDIKLELNNGTLTLKAGSKLYKPNGADVFDTFIVETDLSRSTWGSGSTDLMVVFDTVNSTWGGFETPNCYSGPTAPTGATNMLWYDTTNNKVKQTSNSGSTWNDGWTLPIFIVSRSSGAITGIQQVFNGFGYIGSTVFALPGVKGLIPDGRNADGSLKNTITNDFTTVKTVQVNTSTAKIAMYSGGGIGSQTKNFGLNEAENYNYDSGVLTNALEVARVIVDSSAKITAFTPKTAFHAVDYSDTEYIAHQAMPSDTWENLTYGGSSDFHIAPANGFVLLTAGTTSSGAIAIFVSDSSRTNATEVKDHSNMESGVRNVNGATGNIFVPIRKGQTFTAAPYSGTYNGVKYRFLYAEGEI